MKLSDIPNGTKIILASLGTALLIYGFCAPLISAMVPPQFAAGIAGGALLLTAVFHRSAQIQTVANDIPGLFNGSVGLEQAFNDLKSAIEGNTAATATNTAVTVVTPASNTAPGATAGETLTGA